MTQSVLQALYVHDAPTVAQLGGETAIYAERDVLASTSDVHRVAEALCSEWQSLDDRDSAAAFLVGAVDHVSPFAARDLFNVLLSAEDVLPAIAESFEAALRGLIRGMPLLRDFALEAWTRLALGKWASKPNQLRAALEESSEFDAVSAPLVRAVGAALAHWRDDSFRVALEKLAEHDDVDSDAAMELGFYSVGRALEIEDAADVHSQLLYARSWFSTARADEGRPDAVAFDEVLGGVLDQTAGNEIGNERLREITESVAEYLNGYIGAERGWRYARAQTTGAWSSLLAELHYAASDRWYDAEQTIGSLARTIAAETTMVLVVNTGESPGQPGVRALVESEVHRIARSNGEVVGHMRRWLETSTEEAEGPVRTAVERLLDELQSPPSKKAGRGSAPQLSAIRDHMNLTGDQAAVLEDAAAATPEIICLLETAAAYSRAPRYADEKVILDLLARCHEVLPGGIDDYRYELRQVLNALVQFGALRLNEEQKSQRAAPWFGQAAPWPHEHELADDLNTALRMSGLNSYVEVRNVGGGRVDILIPFDRCTFSIEVKRTDQNQSDADLVTSYGTQSLQYAATDVPVAFLAVADYWVRRTRIDLAGAFHVAAVRVDAESRVYALTTFRAQANVASPSSTSAHKI